MTFRRLLALLLALFCACWSAPLRAADAAPAKKTVKKKKKEYNYDESKYKAYKELVADDTHSYRFDDHGNPIQANAKKKKVSSKKKKKEDEEPAACGAGEACQDDGTGAEAKASVESGD